MKIIWVYKFKILANLTKKNIALGGVSNKI